MGWHCWHLPYTRSTPGPWGRGPPSWAEARARRSAARSEMTVRWVTLFTPRRHRRTGTPGPTGARWMWPRSGRGDVDVVRAVPFVAGRVPADAAVERLHLAPLVDGARPDAALAGAQVHDRAELVPAVAAVGGAQVGATPGLAVVDRDLDRGDRHRSVVPGDAVHLDLARRDLVLVGGREDHALDALAPVGGAVLVRVGDRRSGLDRIVRDAVARDLVDVVGLDRLEAEAGEPLDVHRPVVAGDDQADRTAVRSRERLAVHVGRQDRALHDVVQRQRVLEVGARAALGRRVLALGGDEPRLVAGREGRLEGVQQTRELRSTEGDLAHAAVRPLRAARLHRAREEAPPVAAALQHHRDLLLREVGQRRGVHHARERHAAHQLDRPAVERLALQVAPLGLRDLVVADVQDLLGGDGVLAQQVQRRLEHAGPVVVHDQRVALAGDHLRGGLQLLRARELRDGGQAGAGGGGQAHHPQELAAFELGLLDTAKGAGQMLGHREPPGDR